MAITHAFVSAKGDGADATVVRPSDWNAAHSGGYADSDARAACIAATISDADTTHAPDGNSVFDALALKAPLISPSFTTPVLGTPASGNLVNCTGIILGMTWTLITSDPAPAVTRNGYMCNTTGGAFTVTLPAAPSVGDLISICDAAGTFNTNNLNIGRAGNNIMSLAADMTVSSQYATFDLVYASAALGWRIA